MEYRFGPGKPEFNGTAKEWNELKEKIAWAHDKGSDYPLLRVLCPHCGSQNTHTHNQSLRSHYECPRMINWKGRPLKYNCPGYTICHYVDKNYLSLCDKK